VGAEFGGSQRSSGIASDLNCQPRIRLYGNQEELVNQSRFSRPWIRGYNHRLTAEDRTTTLFY
jgi:hypothetical protein